MAFRLRGLASHEIQTLRLELVLIIPQAAHAPYRLELPPWLLMQLPQASPLKVSHAYPLVGGQSGQYLGT